MNGGVPGVEARVEREDADVFEVVLDKVVALVASLDMGAGFLQQWSLLFESPLKLCQGLVPVTVNK